jgi:hypothetical protein
MKQRKSARGATSPAPDPFKNKVTVASNSTQRLVALIFGDPGSSESPFITFTPKQARAMAKNIMSQADIAEGVQ